LILDYKIKFEIASFHRLKYFANDFYFIHYWFIVMTILKLYVIDVKIKESKYPLEF